MCLEKISRYHFISQSWVNPNISEAYCLDKETVSCFLMKYLFWLFCLSFTILYWEIWQWKADNFYFYFRGCQTLSYYFRYYEKYWIALPEAWIGYEAIIIVKGLTIFYRWKKELFGDHMYKGLWQYSSYHFFLTERCKKDYFLASLALRLRSCDWFLASGRWS